MAIRNDAHVVIVGGGATGAGLVHDLAPRGLRVTLLDRGELTSGTTGRHHGLLHSGARYAVGDREAGLECIRENTILKRIVRQTRRVGNRDHLLDPAGHRPARITVTNRETERAAARGGRDRARNNNRRPIVLARSHLRANANRPTHRYGPVPTCRHDNLHSPKRRRGTIRPHA